MRTAKQRLASSHNWLIRSLCGIRWTLNTIIYSNTPTEESKQIAKEILESIDKLKKSMYYRSDNPPH